MAIDRVSDYRAILPANRSRRERDDKKQRKPRRDPPLPSKEHQIDERA
jgi:hypothetical protein